MSNADTSNIIDFFEAKKEIELEQLRKGLEYLAGNLPPPTEDGELEEP